MDWQYTWDAAGRLVSEGEDLCYLYDEWGRLATLGMRRDRAVPCSEVGNVEPLSQYGYDYLGRRVVRQRWGIIGIKRPDAFFYDQFDRLIANGYAAENHEDLVPTRMYIYLGDKPLAHLDLAYLKIDPEGCTCRVPAGGRSACASVLWLLGLCACAWLGLGRGRPRWRRGLAGGLALVLVLGLPLVLGRCVASPLSKPEVYYYHNDPLGTPMMLTDEKANPSWAAHYDDFGALDNVWNYDYRTETPLRFPGQYEDDDKRIVSLKGPYYNLNRYYDPMIGRYITPDPLGLSETSRNLYTYADNDPVNHSDPLGLFYVAMDSNCPGWVRSQIWRSIFVLEWFMTGALCNDCLRKGAPSRHDFRSDARRLANIVSNPAIGAIGCWTREGRLWSLDEVGQKPKPAMTANPRTARVPFTTLYREAFPLVDWETGVSGATRHCLPKVLLDQAVDYLTVPDPTALTGVRRKYAPSQRGKYGDCAPCDW